MFDSLYSVLFHFIFYKFEVHFVISFLPIFAHFCSIMFRSFLLLHYEPCKEVFLLIFLLKTLFYTWYLNSTSIFKHVYAHSSCRRSHPNMTQQSTFNFIILFYLFSFYLSSTWNTYILRHFVDWYLILIPYF